MRPIHYRRPTVASTLEAHARSQRGGSPDGAQRVAPESRIIPPAIAEVLRHTFG